jgi:predicted RNA-binding Zn-ribbon protein involved in translation (DUF1610 family)
VTTDTRQSSETAIAVRLTAALILRNLAIVTENRLRLLPHEFMLFDRAAKDSNLQAILATCLALLNSAQSQKDAASSPVRNFGELRMRAAPAKEVRQLNLHSERDDDVDDGEPQDHDSSYLDMPSVKPSRDRSGRTVFKCQTCGKGFATNFVMKRHARMHTNVKNFECPTCGKEFNRKDAMKQHAQVHTKSGW